MCNQCWRIHSTSTLDEAVFRYTSRGSSVLLSTLVQDRHSSEEGGLFFILPQGTTI